MSPCAKKYCFWFFTFCVGESCSVWLSIGRAKSKKSTSFVRVMKTAWTELQFCSVIDFECEILSYVVRWRIAAGRQYHRKCRHLGWRACSSSRRYISAHAPTPAPRIPRDFRCWQEPWRTARLTVRVSSRLLCTAQSSTRLRHFRL